MNKKKLLSLVAALTLVGVVGIGATLAYFTDKADIENVFTMGHVDVTLTEKEVVFDEETGEYVEKEVVFDEETGEYVENEDVIDEDGLEFDDVMPGQTVPKTPTITVAADSQDAYVRAQIIFDGLNEQQQADLLAGIAINDGWTLTDGYYYYNVAMSAEEEVALFEEVKIPANWGNEVADLEFAIQIYAEAIQADYVEDVIVTDNDGNVVDWELGDATIEEYVAAQ